MNYVEAAAWVVVGFDLVTRWFVGPVFVLLWLLTALCGRLTLRKESDL